MVKLVRFHRFISPDSLLFFFYLLLPFFFFFSFLLNNVTKDKRKEIDTGKKNLSGSPNNEQYNDLHCEGHTSGTRDVNSFKFTHNNRRQVHRFHESKYKLQFNIAEHKYVIALPIESPRSTEMLFSVLKMDDYSKRTGGRS